MRQITRFPFGIPMLKFLLVVEGRQQNSAGKKSFCVCIFARSKFVSFFLPQIQIKERIKLNTRARERLCVWQTAKNAERRAERRTKLFSEYAVSEPVWYSHGIIYYYYYTMYYYSRVFARKHWTACTRVVFLCVPVFVCVTVRSVYSCHIHFIFHSLPRRHRRQGVWSEQTICWPKVGWIHCGHVNAEWALSLRSQTNKTR